MRMKLSMLLFCSVLSMSVFGQGIEFMALSIPAALKENADAVVRSDVMTVNIVSQDEMTIRHRRVITILNKGGFENLMLGASYDKNRKVSAIEARMYDAMGKETKVYKKKDFRDVSLGDGFSVFNDNRVLYLDHTPTAYPFTIAFESETKTSNTAFIPTWQCVSAVFTSMQEKRIEITYPQGLGFGYKEENFGPRFDVKKEESAGKIVFSAVNVPAVKPEEYSPGLDVISPKVYFKLEKFNLEGLRGQAANWEELGKWFYDNLLTGTDAVSPETQTKIKTLVGSETDPVKIARIVYRYVQSRTRYVSIQIGIGGFKPMLASDVDRLGYGDCKALSNYTRSLLKCVGVESYYAVVDAGGSKVSLLPDFASVQGNHAILALPVKDGFQWMECTSQISPFGFPGNFTDDRQVLIVTPEGGKIVRTPTLRDVENLQFTKGKYALSATGGISGDLSIESKGIQYDQSYGRSRYSESEKERFYKNYFGHINGVKLDKIEFENDAENVKFTQRIAISSPSYANLSGNRILFSINAYNLNSDTPKRYRNRENPFRVNRGYEDRDEITVSLPDGFDVEAMPQDVSLVTKFGEYSLQIVRNPDNSLLYKRRVFIKDGAYPKEEYDAYRLFREQIAKNDNAKVVLAKKV